MLVNNILYLILVTIILFVTSGEMSLFTIGVMLPVLCFVAIYGSYMRKVNKEVSDKKAKMTELAEEAFSNIRTVKAFATEDYETIRYFERNTDVFDSQFKISMAQCVFQIGIQYTMFGTLTALIYFASVLARNNQLSIGEFTSFQFYMFSFLLNFTQIASIFGEVIGLYGTMEGIAEITLYEAKVPISGGD